MYLYLLLGAVGLHFRMVMVFLYLFQGAAKTVNTNGESRLFWLSLVVSQVFWVIFIFAAVLTLSIKWIVREILITFYLKLGLFT